MCLRLRGLKNPHIQLCLESRSTLKSRGWLLHHRRAGAQPHFGREGASSASSAGENPFYDLRAGALQLSVQLSASEAPWPVCQSDSRTQVLLDPCTSMTTDSIAFPYLHVRAQNTPSATCRSPGLPSPAAASFEQPLSPRGRKDAPLPPPPRAGSQQTRRGPVPVGLLASGLQDFAGFQARHQKVLPDTRHPKRKTLNPAWHLAGSLRATATRRS